MWFRKGSKTLRDLLNNPVKVTFICVIFFAMTLLLDGNFLRLWGLSREIDFIHEDSDRIKIKSEQINRQLAQLKDLDYIERMAKDRLDLAGKEDLVFVFSD